jgi:hypothetical protein
MSAVRAAPIDAWLEGPSSTAAARPMTPEDARRFGGHFSLAKHQRGEPRRRLIARVTD